MLATLHSDTNSLKFVLFHLTGRLIVDQEKLGLFIVTYENVTRMKQTGFLTHKYVQIFSYDQYQITYKTFSAVSYHFIPQTFTA
jgi:hypothetical protein